MLPNVLFSPILDIAVALTVILAVDGAVILATGAAVILAIVDDGRVMTFSKSKNTVGDSILFHHNVPFTTTVALQQVKRNDINIIHLVYLYGNERLHMENIGHSLSNKRFLIH